jgi:hypothetical protein
MAFRVCASAFLVWASASMLVACGGSDDDGVFASGGAAGSGGSAGAGATGGAGAAGGAGGAGGSVDTRIDPIELGYEWTYEVEVLGTYPLCKQGTHSGFVLGEKEVGGKQAFQVQSLCPGAGVSSYYVDGDRVEVYYGGNWLLALDTPVEEGHTWSNGASTFTWHDAGTVTVPAGSFDDCWTAKENVANESYTTFCRGIGPVHWHVESGGNGFDAKLSAKNF